MATKKTRMKQGRGDDEFGDYIVVEMEQVR